MKKQITLIINKLNKQPLYSLSPEEIRLYFEHRFEKVVQDKKVVTKNELDYLLSETGPGNRRFDPRLISLLSNVKIFTYPPYENLPEIQKLSKQKEKVDRLVLAEKNSNKTQELIIKLLGNYLKDIKIVSSDTLTIKANFGDTPILCLIKNGSWIFPDTKLFSFLKNAQDQKRFPIVIAKKISGILFPVFKGISVVGLNLYKTYLPAEAKKTTDSATYKPEEKFLSELKYNDQFQFLTKEYTDRIRDDYWSGDQLKNFFETILPNNIITNYKNFLELKINIANNFIETVSQFRKNKATKGLIESYQTLDKLFTELNS
jgi:hypothetical protein